MASPSLLSGPLPPRSALLLALHRDAVSCILDFLPLSDIAALLSSCRRWPARDAELANIPHPRKRSPAAVRVMDWKPGHPLWDCRSPLRHLVAAVSVGATVPSALAQLRIDLPYLRELHFISSRVVERLEWSLPLRLEVLDVEWRVDGVMEAVNGVTASLPHLMNLTTLRLISYRPFSDCEPLLDAVRVHPSITQLEMRPFTDSMLQYLARLPHTLRLCHLRLPYDFSIYDVRGAALAKIPSLTILDSVSFWDLSCLSSLPALTKLRVHFVSDSEEDPFWDEQAEADIQSSLFLEHLPQLAELRRFAMQLPARVNCLRKSFVGEILFHAIHRSNFHLVELDLCDWLLKSPLLFSLLRLPALATLQTFRHRFTSDYFEDDDGSLQQLSTEDDAAIMAMHSHPLSLPHLTALQVTHPRMTKVEFSALLMGMPSLTDLRLDSQFPWLIDRRDYIGIGCVTSNPAFARTLRILHMDRREYQHAELQNLFLPAAAE